MSFNLAQPYRKRMQFQSKRGRERERERKGEETKEEHTSSEKGIEGPKRMYVLSPTDCEAVTATQLTFTAAKWAFSRQIN